MMEAASRGATAAYHISYLGSREEGYCAGRAVLRIQEGVEYHVLGACLAVVVRCRQLKTTLVAAFIRVIQSIFEVET